jgi:hypothetical protein
MAFGRGFVQVAHLRVARHIQHIAPAPPTQFRPEDCTASEFVIACDPAKRQHHATAVE